MYDTIVVGGGIAGMYVALDSPRTLVLESTSRLGGRIYTHKTPHYEVGAGRIHASHRLLRKLLKRYNLTEIPLPQSPTDKALLDVLPLDRDESMRNITYSAHCRRFYSPEQVDALRHAFGFWSEFEVMNAYDACDMLTRALRGKYFIVKEGLSELIHRMAKDLHYKLNHAVQHIEILDSCVRVDEYTAKRVIFAIPPHELAQFKLLRPSDLHAVAPLALLRIYAAYETDWAANLPSQTTDSWLRHIIPITPRLVMVAYVEGGDIDPYRTQSNALRADSKLNSMIHTELRRIFPDREIPDPIHFKAYLWDRGGHAWLPGVNSDEVASRVLFPAERIGLCGEAFSHKQAWMEGALETAEIHKKNSNV